MSLSRLNNWRPTTPFATAALVLFAAFTANAAGVRPQDEVLLFNSRRTGCTTDVERLAKKLTAERYVPGSGKGKRGKWADASWQEIVTADGLDARTIIYAHGNDIMHHEARSRGLDVYRRLVRSARDDRPVRFIIWSWPSSPISGRLKNYRVKAARTRPAAYQLAWVVQQMPPEMPLGFIGYSYGARIENGAAHLLAGGSLGGRRLAHRTSVDRPTEHVYIAPAFERGWLAPRMQHGLAMKQIDHLLLTVNPRDPAMRFFSLVALDRGDRALGYGGPSGLPRGYASRVRNLSVGSSVGRSHDLYNYLNAPGFMSEAWRRLTFAGKSAPCVTPVASRVVCPAGH